MSNNPLKPYLYADRLKGKAICKPDLLRRMEISLWEEVWNCLWNQRGNVPRDEVKMYIDNEETDTRIL